MSIKLNGYTLTDDTINQMKSVMRKSIKIDTELGFTLCSDKENNLHARNICAGEDFLIKEPEMLYKI